MTELLLKREKGEWRRVYFEAQQSFKLTRENPYFTQSDSYTLDVTIPMIIIENHSQRMLVRERATQFIMHIAIIHKFHTRPSCGTFYITLNPETLF